MLVKNVIFDDKRVYYIRLVVKRKKNGFLQPRSPRDRV